MWLLPSWVSWQHFMDHICCFLLLVSMSHSEEQESFWNVVGFFLVYTMCFLPSFIFNYFHYYSIPCLLIYLKILSVASLWILESGIEMLKGSVCFVTVLIQSRSKSWIYVLASKINSLSSILRVLFSFSIDFFSYFSFSGNLLHP